MIQIDNRTDQPIPFGAFAKVEFLGKTIDNTLWLPQSALIDQTSVWGVSHEQRLYKMAVKPLQYTDKHVLVQYVPSESVVAIVEQARLSFFEQQAVRPTTPPVSVSGLFTAPKPSQPSQIKSL